MCSQFQLRVAEAREAAAARRARRASRRASSAPTLEALAALRAQMLAAGDLPPGAASAGLMLPRGNAEPGSRLFSHPLPCVSPRPDFHPLQTFTPSTHPHTHPAARCTAPCPALSLPYLLRCALPPFPSPPCPRCNAGLRAHACCCSRHGHARDTSFRRPL